MATLAELTTPLTPAQVQESIYGVLAALGVNTAGWKPGAVVRALITGVSTVLAAFTELTAAVARSGFLEYSSDAWLTLVARHTYGVERIPATFAAGNITLSNSGGGVYAFDPGDLIVVNPTTGKGYRNTASASLGALQSGLVVAVQAIEAGSGSTSAPGTITQLETTLPGVTVTNANAIVGADEETDTALKARCRDRFEALSPNGPANAYDYFARSAVRADGTAIGVTRTRVMNGGNGTVTVSCATATGGVTGTAGNPATDLGAINRTIQLNAVPLGVTCNVQTATVQTVNVTYAVWIYSSAGLTDAQVRSTVADAITAYIAARPIGGDNATPTVTGNLYVSGLIGAIINARPEIFAATVAAPSGDLSVGASFVLQPGTITCSAVTQVDP
jgi:phage-related baseplate assembly protein